MDQVGRIHGGNLRAAAEEYGVGEADFLDFSANINPLGPSPKAVEAIIRDLAVITRYPDPEAKKLRQTASRLTGLPEKMIAAGNGAAELIDLVIRVLRPGEVLIPAPTFNEYENAVSINGGIVRDLKLAEMTGFALEPENLFQSWQQAEAVFICNPNNPTGVVTARRDLLKILDQAAASGKYLIVDEAFLDFVDEGSHISVMDLVPKYDNLIVLYSLTKFYAIPGLRLGLAAANEQVIQGINRLRDPWNVNALAQVAGVAALEDLDYIKKSKAFMHRERTYLYKELTHVKGFRPLKPSANYIFINVEETGFSSGEICARLGRNGILVRDCGTYKNLRPAYIRVAVRTRDENLKLLEALHNLGGNKNG